MRLIYFKVTGLFGMFDHEIAPNLNERVTIVHAPNGYGKTVVLKLIAAFFDGRFNTFRSYEFREIEMRMDSGDAVLIRQAESESDEAERASNQRERYYKITAVIGGETHEWDPFKETESLDNLSDHSVYLARDVLAIPPTELQRLSARELAIWRDSVDRYYHQFPARLRRRNSTPKWLSDFRSVLHCRLIETQRLLVVHDGGDKKEAFRPAVKNYASELSAMMERALADSATLSQSLDESFPNRLLTTLRDPADPMSEVSIRERLADLDKKRARLAAADLLEKSGEAALTPADNFDLATRKVLSQFVADSTEKLSVYDEILEKIELFVRLLSERFQFKTVHASRSSGFKIIDYNSRELDPESLSSGEQHELVLVFDLIFKTKKNALILIDEPEISLHIAWQRNFLSDLRDIISLNPIDIILATHSPQLVGPDLDLVVQLEGPRLGATDI